MHDDSLEFSTKLSPTGSSAQPDAPTFEHESSMLRTRLARTSSSPSRGSSALQYICLARWGLGLYLSEARKRRRGSSRPNQFMEGEMSPRQGTKTIVLVTNGACFVFYTPPNHRIA